MEKNRSARKTVLVIALVLVLIGIGVVSVLLVMSLNENSAKPVVQISPVYNENRAEPSQNGTSEFTKAPTVMPTAEPTVPPTTEPATSPDTKIMLTEDGHVFLSGKPELGITEKDSYVNPSIALSCTLSNDMQFLPMSDILEINEVENVNELLRLDGPVLALTTDRSLMIVCYRLGSNILNGCETVEEALKYCADADLAYLDGQYETTLEEFENVYVTFSAGKVGGYLVRTICNGDNVAFLHLGYQVGDYMAFISIYEEDLDGIERILSGIGVG